MSVINKKIRAIFIFLSLLSLSQEVYAFDAANVSKISVTVAEKSGKDLRDYQVLIDLNENNFSFDSDKDKLSFIDEDGTVLNYWIEEWNSSAEEAKIWVKVPELKANESKTIYMDLNGDSLPSGENTFDFFDDFENYTAGQTLIGKNGWNNSYERDSSVFGVNNKNVLVQNDQASHGENSLRIYSSNVSRANAEKSLSISNDVMLEYDIRTNKVINATYDWVISAVFAEENDLLVQIYFDRQYDRRGDEISYDNISDGVDNNAIAMQKYQKDKWYNFKVWLKFKEKKMDIWIDGEKKASDENFYTKNASVFKKINFDAYSVSEVYAWFDNVHVRKYVSPEPEVILGEDLSIEEKSLLIARKDADFYSVKGKLSSTFKDSLENIDIAVYNDDPRNSSPAELARIVVDKIKAGEEKEFEIIVTKDDSGKSNELYVFADPDNKIAEGNKTNNIAKRKIPENILETISPLLISIIIFIFIFLILSILYYSHKISQKNRGAQKQIFQTKACLKCGMVLDKNQSKCPVCGMKMFKQ